MKVYWLTKDSAEYIFHFAFTVGANDKLIKSYMCESVSKDECKGRGKAILLHYIGLKYGV